MAIATVDPNTGNTIRTFQPHTDAQLEEKLARAVVGARLQRERKTEGNAVLSQEIDLR